MYNNSTPIGGQVSSARGNLVRATKSNPCPHCGKPDWCYFIGELSVCNRDQPPATGWEATSKKDQDGHAFYAPVQEKKATRSAKTCHWEYPARDGSPLVRVVRVDDGSGNKKIWQERWDGSAWVKGTKGINRADIPIYRYAEIQKAIANNELIFIVEGETCADALWTLGLAATCNIGGAKKWRNSDTSDLRCAGVVICPDRDVPGLEHATEIYKDFPNAQWLHAYPNSKAWDNLPKSGGLDVADWIESEKLDAQALLNSLTLPARTGEQVVCQKYDSNTSNYIPDTAPIATQNFVQKAESALYGNGHWVSIAGQLYHWVGSHYESRSEAEEKRRISDWLSTYSEKVKGKRLLTIYLDLPRIE